MTNQRAVGREVTVRREHPEVLTVLEPWLRKRVEMGAQGTFKSMHASSVTEAGRLLRERTFTALLLSPSAAEGSDLGALGRLVAASPGLQVATVFIERLEASDRLLELGAHGVRYVIDLESRDGWGRLRTLVSENADRTPEKIWNMISGHLADVSPGMTRFFETLVWSAPRTSSAREFARRLNVHPTTLMSRFFRMRLPSPKTYLAYTRLLFASELFQARSVSISCVANHLAYSSPQCFGRNVKSLLGVSAGVLRQYKFQDVLAHYVGKLLSPYSGVFREFEPCRERLRSPSQAR